MNTKKHVAGCFFFFLLVVAPVFSDAPWMENVLTGFESHRTADDRPFFQMELVPLTGGPVRLSVIVPDGGCIESDTLVVSSLKDGEIREIDLLYTLEGQPCKALFARELTAALNLPEAGRYRIRLWLYEAYYQQKGKELIGERNISIR